MDLRHITAVILQFASKNLANLDHHGVPGTQFMHEALSRAIEKDETMAIAIAPDR